MDSDLFILHVLVFLVKCPWICKFWNHSCHERDPMTVVVEVQVLVGLQT